MFYWFGTVVEKIGEFVTRLLDLCRSYLAIFFVAIAPLMYLSVSMNDDASRLRALDGSRRVSLDSFVLLLGLSPPESRALAPELSQVAGGSAPATGPHIPLSSRTARALKETAGCGSPYCIDLTTELLAEEKTLKEIRSHEGARSSVEGAAGSQEKKNEQLNARVRRAINANLRIYQESVTLPLRKETTLRLVDEGGPIAWTVVDGSSLSFLELARSLERVGNAAAVNFIPVENSVPSSPDSWKSYLVDFFILVLLVCVVVQLLMSVNNNGISRVRIGWLDAEMDRLRSLDVVKRGHANPEDHYKFDPVDSWSRAEGQMDYVAVRTFTKAPVKAKEEAAPEEEKPKVLLDDVRGIAPIKNEVLKYIDFLKNPDKYYALGARMPRGLLMHGQPGCGKTMLAKAIANEAGVTFFQFSGGEFFKKFVGESEAMVRNVFAAARKETKAIIFIDEIDAVGSTRLSDDSSAGRGYNATLNTILTEMDGFNTGAGGSTILVIGATNMPEKLDEALMRPGRFDSKLEIPLPDLLGRIDILSLYAQKKKISPSVDLRSLAGNLVGFTGAMLEGLLNEAAILAAREGASEVSEGHISRSRLLLLMGAERPLVLSPKEKHICAVHEVGHALASFAHCPHIKVTGVSVLPRGQSLGQTWIRPCEDQNLKTEAELTGEIIMLLGGRAAEEVVFGSVTTGASDDLSKANDTALNMALRYGMGKRTGLSTLTKNTALNRRTLDSASADAKEIIHSCYKQAITLMTDKLELLLHVADELERLETLDEKTVDEMLGSSTALPS